MSKIKKYRNRFFYVVLFSLGIGFVYYQNRDLSFLELADTLRRCRIQWVLFALVSHWINHALRAYRWKLLLRISNEEVKVRNAILAEMSGFCMTMAFSRVGEVIRARGLKKLEGTDVKVSLGSIVIERGLDMFFFMIIAIGFTLFNTELLAKAGEVIAASNVQPSKDNYIWYLLGGLVLAAFSFYAYKKKLWHAIWMSLLSFLKVIRNLFVQLWGFKNINIWMVTLLIWLFHFLVEYLTFFAFVETSQFSLVQALYVFLVANLGMAAPVPGGVGVYEVLVCKAIQQQGINKVTGFAYAIITHGIQVFNAFVVGGIATLIVLFWPAKKKAKEPKLNDQKA